MTEFESNDFEDYDVLIRRQDATGYPAYCPQLMYMIKGTAHEEVEELMKEHIREHIKKLSE